MSLIKNIKLIPELIEKINKLEQINKLEKNKLFSWDNPVIEFENNSNNESPKFSYKGDSGFDFAAYITSDEKNVKFDFSKSVNYIELKPMEHRLIDTGIKVKLIKNTELQVRPRSGCAAKLGLSVLNTPGTVDEKYRGNIKINLINLSNEVVTIYNGDRIAQGVIMPVLNEGTFSFKEVNSIEDYEEENSRSSKGFGSSGIK